MRIWIDSETGCKMCEPNCADEWLQFIWEIGWDYDGYTKASDLRDLIDELISMSQKARDCLRQGLIFPKDTIELKS